ncbi:MAG: glycosyltransferase [Desulfurococcaceae archaeon]
MAVVIVFPGFGYDVIDHNIIQRQPWYYLIQIAENLVASGYKVKLCFQGTRPHDKLTNALLDRGINTCSSFEFNRSDFIIIPFAVGYYAKLYERLNRLTSELNCRVYLALTTYVDNIKELITNFIIVKLTMTGKTIGKTLAENMALRIWHKKILDIVSGVITPSHDFTSILYNLGISQEIKMTEFIPQVDVPYCHETNHDEGKDIITYFGPFDEERGVISLIDAFLKLIKNQNSDAVLKLLLRGDGYSLLPIMNRKIRMKKQNIVVKTKFENRQMLFNELCTSKLIVLPYRVIPSTLPVSYFEALFLDKPLVVTTDIPGFRGHIYSYLGKTIPGTYRHEDLAKYLTFLLSSTEDVRLLKSKQTNYAISLKNKIQRQLISLPEE